ncbi:MAG: WcaF family extracellular polysaccharide biosynthesis acetyltransferase [Bacteroidales bacterium]|nr:WcaF family extracellular polysaccharide biosynthesis acetyltransferase [Bacteroidales bacterium]
MKSTELSKYNYQGYSTQRSIIIRFLWYLINYSIFKSPFCLGSFIKRFLLRLFGAKVGKGVVIKPRVNIKYPWFLSIGDNCWIGEEVWIDNLVEVKIGNNCCISQRALIETGNHNYSYSDFRLSPQSIILEDGVWICASSIVVSGTICKSHSVLCVGSVSPKIMDAYSIYKGNPAVKVKNRVIND